MSGLKDGMLIIEGTAENWKHAECPTCVRHGMPNPTKLFIKKGLPHCSLCDQAFLPYMLKGPITAWNKETLDKLK